MALYVIELKTLAYMAHDAVMRETGGTVGVRYDADLERVADLMGTARTIAHKHPFVDGNKRTGFIIYMLNRSDEISMEEIVLALKTGDEEGRVARVIDDIIDEHIDWLVLLSDI